MYFEVILHYELNFSVCPSVRNDIHGWDEYNIPVFVFSGHPSASILALSIPCGTAANKGKCFVRCHIIMNYYDGSVWLRTGQMSHWGGGIWPGWGCWMGGGGSVSYDLIGVCWTAGLIWLSPAQRQYWSGCVLLEFGKSCTFLACASLVDYSYWPIFPMFHQ